MAEFLLNNRAQLRRAMFRLLMSDGTDAALTEQGEGTDEVAHFCLQHGLWNSQKFLIRTGFREWLTSSGALTWSEAAADGTRYVALPADFLRFAGDERRPALLDAQGRTWGGLIQPRDKRQATARAYWIENGRIWLGRGSAPPTGLYYEYHYKAPELTSDEEEAEGGAIDFPEDWRPLIPAEGAIIASLEGWYKVGPAGEAKIVANRNYWRSEAAPWFRQTQEPQKLNAPDVIGSRIFIR